MRKYFLLLLAAPTSMAILRCVGDAPPPDAILGSDASGSDSSNPAIDSSFVDGSKGDENILEANAGDTAPAIPDILGVVDTTFANGAKIQADGGSLLNFPIAMAIDSQSRTYVVGNQPNCATASSSYDFFVFRLDANGNLDTSYGTSGIRCIDFDTNDSDTPFAAAIDANGNLLVGGSSDGTNGAGGASVVKLDPTGTILWKYRYENGDASSTAANTVKGFAFDNARIYAVGTNGSSNSNSTASFIIALQSSSGTVDTGWGPQGLQSDNVAFSNLGGVVVASNLIVVGGTAGVGRKFLTRRFSSQGILDVAFGSNGAISTEISTSTTYDTAFSIAIQSDSKIVVAGASGSTKTGSNTALASVVRYQPNGAGLDTTFSPASTVPGTYVSTLTWNDATDNQSSGLVLASSGKIILGGMGLTADGGTLRDYALTRLNTNGTIDTSFGKNGIAHSDFPTPSVVSQIAMDPTTGKIVVLGRDNFENPVVYRFQ